MVCLFSVLYFLYLLLSRPRALREVLHRAGLFAAFSLLAGGLSAFTLLPTYLALGNTIASGLGFLGEVTFTHSFLEILKAFLPFGKISLEFGAPNLYCGTVALLLFLLAAFLPGKRLRERILLLFGAALIYLSSTVNLLDFVWHGFHFPNQLPGRQSFIFIFFILTEGYGALLLLVRALRRARPARILARALSLLLAAEVLLSGVWTVGTQTWTCNLSSYAYWDRSMRQVEEKYTDGPYRSEKITCFNFNAPMLYGYRGISYYSSTMTADAYRFFGRLGMGVYAQNVSTMYVPTNITNMLFGVQYLHAYNGDLPGSLYLDEVEALETVTVYKNRYCLPLAFAASREALTLPLDGYSPTTLQNAMLASLLGDEETARYMSEGALSSAYARLSPGGMEITGFSDTHIRGTVTAGEDSFLFTSIAYDAGWRVKVDGERVEPLRVFDYLLGIPLSSGEHTVELSYTAPGFYGGLAISLLSAAAVTLYTVLAERRRRGKK